MQRRKMTEKTVFKTQGFYLRENSENINCKTIIAFRKIFRLCDFPTKKQLPKRELLTITAYFLIFFS